ncbi:hypothetical protein [Lutibacter sp. Hel_I_33_5]|uniref:hypothetical protein n=1 Tax=Lutibacter sp. Hel_I_33_5 TaxID=1566289 RepID=UPI0011A43B3B|nr:hypothetical protein [Lutibacter sp. Hel_I_33_5]
MTKKTYTENQLSLHKKYKIGDVRRYGIFPDSANLYRHPLTNNPKITDVLDIAENEGVELFFPKGHYNLPLILDSRENIKINSDSAEFDIIHITINPKTKKQPKNIEIKGTIISFDQLGISGANNVKIDTIIIKSDIVKSALKMRARGCHIYYGSKYISIKYLEIYDFGSGDKRYSNNHAALTIDGMGNQPKNVLIDKVYIKSTDRHGVYITGENHFIGNIVIDKFGVGSSNYMLPMQDADLIEEKLFSAVWINKCYNSIINNIYINNIDSKGFFTANFDEGDLKKPVIIQNLEVENFNRTLPIRFVKNTGVKVGLIIK